MLLTDGRLTGIYGIRQNTIAEMPRFTLSLPTEFGRGEESRRSHGSGDREAQRRELRIGRRTDGVQSLEPVIVRWFRTWATASD